MGSKEEFYKGEDWVSRGDAYKVGEAPHLGKAYECGKCSGGHIKVELVLTPKETKAPVVEVVGSCITCAQSYIVLVSRGHIKG